MATNKNGAGDSALKLVATATSLKISKRRSDWSAVILVKKTAKIVPVDHEIIISSEQKGVAAIFDNLLLKLVTISTSLQRSEDECQINYLHPFLHQFWKFCEKKNSQISSETIGLIHAWACWGAQGRFQAIFHGFRPPNFLAFAWSVTGDISAWRSLVETATSIQYNTMFVY